MNVLYAEYVLTSKAPNTTTAKFANTADPDETAHNVLPHPRSTVFAR